MQFNALPVNVQWAILTALRGPDRGKCKYMKELFTARIRYWAHVLFGLTNPINVGAVKRDYAPDVLLVEGAEKEAAEWLREDEYGYHHWSNHIYLYLEQDDAKEAEFLSWIVLFPQEDWTKRGREREVPMMTSEGR